MARIRFHHYAWGLLGYNLAVILGGAYVRASISGDGCGSHWPDCNGALVPMAGQLKQFVEYGHRLSTGLDLPLAIGLLVWAFLAFPKGHAARRGSAWVIGLIILEALIGAALVLFRWVAHDDSVYRAIAMPTHLVATFGLLMALALTAWFGSGHTPVRLRGQGAMGWVMGIGLFAIVLLGISGAITALGDTLFPARSLVEGLKQDLAPSHFLLGLRIYHPLIAVTAGLYLVLAAGLAMKLRPSPIVERVGYGMVVLFLAQMGAGMLNLGLLAPIWMQMIHLLLADLTWITMVLLTAAALAEGVPQVELSAVGPVPHPAAPPATWRDYVALTKPRVISLLILTTLAAMFIAGRNGYPAPSFLLCVAVGIGMYAAAGAANTINMVLERDLDLAMGRTANRPTVTEAVPARAALCFALALTVLSFLVLWLVANLLAAMLALAGLAFYVIIYTLLLKRRTWANIVIGGAAGAFPPLVGWAAVTGNLSAMAWVLFGIVFLWTPVHFWALAIMIKDDYARAGVPMLPVVRGERATVVQILQYTACTIAITAVPMLLQERGESVVGVFYVAAAALLNAVLIARSFRLWQRPDYTHARSLFKYSMVYLALLFLAMAVDHGQWN